MDLELVRILLQSLSSFAILGGCIYAAFQFRQAQRAARVANFTKLVELQMMLRKMRVDDPSLASIYQHDVQNLSSDREIREHFFNLMQVSVFEIVWYANREGQAADDYFTSWENRMKQIAVEPSFQRMMSSPNMKILHDEFQRYMAAMVAEAMARKAQ